MGEPETKQEKKRYWLKLEKNFLQSKYIKIIKNYPNGQDYILFYLALMLESVDSVGHLKFTDLVPYDEQMLSSLTDTNIDIVRSAMNIFQKLGMITILEDGTIFLPEVPKLTGKESESAERVRQFRKRERQKALQCNTDVTNSNDNKEKEKQEDKQEDKQEKKQVDKEKQKKKQSKEITETMSQALQLASLLLHKCREFDSELHRGKDKAVTQRWARDIEKLIRIDGRSFTDIEAEIYRVKTDGNFWLPNIMSGKKLREKFPRLFAEKHNKRTEKKTVNYQEF